MSEAPTKRPGGVTFIGVLVIISGILYILSGIIALVVAASGAGTATQSWGVLIPGIAIIIFGVIELAVARGLFRGNNVSRIIVAIVNVLIWAMIVYETRLYGEGRRQVRRPEAAEA